MKKYQERVSTATTEPFLFTYQESSASEKLVWLLEEQKRKGLPSAFPSGEEAKLEGRKQGSDQSWLICTYTIKWETIFNLSDFHYGFSDQEGTCFGEHRPGARQAAT